MKEVLECEKPLLDIADIKIDSFERSSPDPSLAQSVSSDGKKNNANSDRKLALPTALLEAISDAINSDLRYSWLL